MFNRRSLLTIVAGLVISLSPAALLAHPVAPRKTPSRAPELQKFENYLLTAADRRQAFPPELAPAPAKPAFHTSRRYRYMQVQNETGSSETRTN